MSIIVLKSYKKGEIELGRLHAIDQQFPQWSWKMEDWEKINLNNYYKLFYLQRQIDKKIFGFILFYDTHPEDTLHLLKICIDKCEQQEGFGTTLLKESLSRLLMKEARSVYLEVEKTNKTAVGFYLKHGFEVVCEKRNFYGPMRHALVMSGPSHKISRV